MNVSVLTCIFIIQIIQTRYLVRFEILCDSALQTLMIDRLLKIDPSHINTFTQGSLQSRVLGLAQLRSIVSSNLTPILTALTSFYLIYLSFYYSWQLARCSDIWLGPCYLYYLWCDNSYQVF